MQADMAVGCVVGHVPQAHMSPAIPIPPAHRHEVVPYVQEGIAPHAKPPAVQVPVGWVAGHVGHVVQFHVSPPIPPMPPKQTQTSLP